MAENKIAIANMLKKLSGRTVANLEPGHCIEVRIELGSWDYAPDGKRRHLSYEVLAFPNIAGGFKDRHSRTVVEPEKLIAWIESAGWTSGNFTLTKLPR